MGKKSIYGAHFQTSDVQRMLVDGNISVLPYKKNSAVRDGHTSITKGSEMIIIIMHGLLVTQDMQCVIQICQTGNYGNCMQMFRMRLTVCLQQTIMIMTWNITTDHDRCMYCGFVPLTWYALYRTSQHGMHPNDDNKDGQTNTKNIRKTRSE